VIALAKQLAIAAVLLLCLFLAPFTFADNKNAADGAFIQEAESKFDIFSLSSFEMMATIHIENKGRMLDGSYRFFWNGPAQWREEIAFPGYGEVQIGGRGVVFLKRSTDFEPVRIEQLHTTLGFGSSGASFFDLDPHPDESIENIQEQSVNGLRARCAKIVRTVAQEKHERRVCVDIAAGTIVRPEGFHDTEIAPVGTKAYPRRLTFMEDGKPTVSIEITELKTVEGIPASVFESPLGATARPGCMNPRRPIPILKVDADYPLQERRNRVQGQVDVYAVIGLDGVPKQLAIARGVSPTLNRQSMNAISRWRFKPATCGGNPVDVEMLISVRFTAY